MGQWWNDSDKTKPNCSEKNFLQCHFVDDKSYMDLPWIEPRSSLFSSVKFIKLADGLHRRGTLSVVQVYGCMMGRILTVHKCVQAVVTPKNGFACDSARCREALFFF